MADNKRREAIVGVSAFNSSGGHFGTQISAEGNAERFGLLDHRLFQESVKGTHKTLILEVANRYGHTWYPVGWEFDNALEDYGHSKPFEDREERILRIAQVCLSQSGSADPAYRDRFTKRVFDGGKEWIDGIQFDQLPWHVNDDLKEYLAAIRRERGAIIILQCQSEVMNALGPEEAVRKLGEYAVADAIDYVLFDASGGTGKKLDVDNLHPYLKAAFGSTALELTGIGIAGGLNASVVRQAMPGLLAEFPDLGWDAEANLRSPGLNGESYLDRDRVQDYLQASAEVIRASCYNA